MDSKLIDVWQASAGNPFLPTVGKGTQFLVAFVLLLPVREEALKEDLS